MFEELNGLLENFSNDLKEYAVGMARKGHKYLQRFGSPGKYRYIYPGGKFGTMSRRAVFFWKRFLKNSKGFLKRYQIAYDSKSFGVKPKTWHTAIINVQRQNGGVLQLHANLQSHGIYSYRSKRGMNSGAAVKLGRAKKRGILRYR